MDTDETTTTPKTRTAYKLSDADKRAIEMHAKWCKRSKEAAPMQDVLYDDNGTPAGTAATYLARVWECSEREAFETSMRLALAGHFYFHLHQWSYAFDFSAVTFNEADHSADMAKAHEELPAMLAELETANKSKPFKWQDGYQQNKAVAFLVAFGKLVTRGFDLYPA